MSDKYGRITLGISVSLEECKLLASDSPPQKLIDTCIKVLISIAKQKLEWEQKNRR